MKKLFALLIALTLALCAAARAEFPQNELLGVWVRDDDPAVSMVFLPGEYARQFGATITPELFAEVTWRESNEWTLLYRLNIGRNLESSQFLMGSSFFGAAINSLAGNIIGSNRDESEYFTSLTYDSGVMESVFTVNTESPDDPMHFPISDKASGVIYVFFDEEHFLNWFDDNDPHSYTCAFVRPHAEVPDPKALTDNILRPIIDMTGDDAPDRAKGILAYAETCHLARMDADAFESSMRDAVSALSREEAQALTDHCADALTHLSDTLIQRPLIHGDQSDLIPPGAEAVWACRMLGHALESVQEPR